MFYRINYQTEPDPISVSRIVGYNDGLYFKTVPVPVYGHKSPRAHKSGFHTFRLKRGEFYSVLTGTLPEAYIHVEGAQIVPMSHARVLDSFTKAHLAAAIDAMSLPSRSPT